MNFVLPSTIARGGPSALVVLPVLPPAVPIPQVRSGADRFRCVPYSCILSAESCFTRQVRAGANFAAKGKGKGRVDSERRAALQAGGSYRACVDCADGRAVVARIGAS